MVKGKPTLEEVARHAGVSPTTASRVVHKTGYVSEANRQAVQKALVTLGYRPNLQARSLRMQSSRTIGLVYSDQQNPFFTKVGHAIRAAAFGANFSMLAVDHDYSAKAEKDGIDQFLDHRVSAVVMCHAFAADNYRPLVKAGVHLIQIERRVVPKTHFVAINALTGLDQALNRLVEAGHRSIAFIGGNNSQLVGRLEPSAIIEEERAEIFRTLATEKGLRRTECPILLGDYFKRPEDGRLSGYQLAEELLEQTPSVTAVIAGSDLLAAGILQSLYERGLRVPEDISLLGYDDTIAEMLTPPLTTIVQPFDEIADSVMGIIARVTPGARLLQKEVTTGLMERNSVARASR